MAAQPASAAPNGTATGTGGRSVPPAVATSRLTTVGRDGVPQPNPVGFLWDGGDSLLTYNQAKAKRLANIRRQPLVSLHFDSDGGGGDIVVFTGTAETLDDYPAVPDNSAWLEKYIEEIDARFGDAVKFAETYSVPVRIHLTRVRGF